MDELILQGMGAPEIMTGEFIRNYARSVDNLNPVHHSEVVAHQSGYEGLIAPSSIHAVYGPIRLGLGSNNWVLPGTLHTRQHMEFHGVIHQNDYLYTNVEKLQSTDSKGRSVHKYISTIKNQHGDVVCVSTGTFLLPAVQQEG